MIYLLPSKTYLLLKQIYEANGPINLTDLNGYEKGNFKDTDLGKRTHHLERLGLITSHKAPPKRRTLPYILWEDGVTMTEDQRRRFESGEIQASQPKTKYKTDRERRTARLEQMRLASKKYRDKALVCLGGNSPSSSSLSNTRLSNNKRALNDDDGGLS